MIPDHAAGQPPMTEPDPLRGPSVRRIPEGDNRERMICAECGYILYDNPKIVVGSVARWGEQDPDVPPGDRSAPRLSGPCRPGISNSTNRRAPAPSARPWKRRAPRSRSRACLAIYDIPRISQVQLIYRARLIDDAVAAGPESLEVGLFGWDEIPWDEIAFPSVRWALHHEREAQAERRFLDPHRPAAGPGILATPPRPSGQ